MLYRLIIDWKQGFITTKANQQVYDLNELWAKDMEGGKLKLSSMGLMRLDFNLDDITSKYFMVRKAETNF